MLSIRNNISAKVVSIDDRPMESFMYSKVPNNRGVWLGEGEGEGKKNPHFGCISLHLA